MTELSPVQMGVVFVDALRAQEWLESFRTKAQRRMSEARVNFLAGLMTSGQWLSYSEIHLGCMEGKQHLIDGQHTLAAIAKTQMPQYVRLTRWHFDSYEDMVKRSAALNDNKRHTMLERLETSGDLDALALTRSQKLSLIRSLVFIDGKFMRSNAIPLSKERTAHLSNEYADMAVLYLDATATCRNNELKKAMRWGVTVATGLATFKSNYVSRTRITEFWQGVAMGGPMDGADPRTKAAAYLEKHKPRNSNGPGVSVSHQSIARYLAACFNRWATGGAVERLHVRRDDEEIEFVGVQFD